jgi:hypothetical protein
LTLAETKRLLAGLQQEIVGEQVRITPFGGVCRVEDCHVRFQGFRTQNPIRLFLFRLISLMQACAVEGGH